MYKIGDKFKTTKKFPFHITQEQADNYEDRYDLLEGEEFEIIRIVSEGVYKAWNISCDSSVSEYMTDEDIKIVIGD